MKDDPIGRKAMRAAEAGARADASRLVANVPAMMREAARRRNEALAPSPTLAQLAARALPRLSAATALAVVAAAVAVVWERDTTPAPAPTTATAFESVVLDGKGGTGDVILDAVLVSGRSRG